MRAMPSAAAVFVLACLTCAPGLRAEETWHTTDGKSFPAELASLREDKASFLLPNGRVITAELSRLSPESQDLAKELGQYQPNVPGGGYELRPEFFLHGLSHDAGGYPVLATVDRENFVVLFRGEEPVIQIYLKTEGVRTGDPITIRYQANSEEEQFGLRIKQAAHVPPTEDSPNVMVYRMQMEGDSTLSIVCEVKQDEVRIAPYVVKNEDLTEDFLKILTPAIALQSNNKDTGYHIGNSDLHPWDEVVTWLKANQAVFGVEGDPNRVGYDLEPAKIPPRMDRFAAGGPAFCNKYVVLETEGGSYLTSDTMEEVEVLQLWTGFALRYNRSKVDSDPREEALVVRIIPAH